jgi:hypothetical protein
MHNLRLYCITGTSCWSRKIQSDGRAVSFWPDIPATDTVTAACVSWVIGAAEAQSPRGPQRLAVYPLWCPVIPFGRQRADGYSTQKSLTSEFVCMHAALLHSPGQINSARKPGPLGYGRFEYIRTKKEDERPRSSSNPIYQYPGINARITPKVSSAGEFTGIRSWPCHLPKILFNQGGYRRGSVHARAVI